VIPRGEELLNGCREIIDAEKTTSADALLANSANQRSMRFSQLQLVGTYAATLWPVRWTNREIDPTNRASGAATYRPELMTKTPLRP
jgi:hypothetical protein